MSLREKKINSLIKLGNWFSEKESNITYKNLQIKSENKNGWFTKWNVDSAAINWGEALVEEDIKKWTGNYSIVEKSKKIALILAGNIPFVGLHDLLCIWFLGHKAFVKLSTKDTYLLPYAIHFLENECPETRGLISFTEKKFQSFDAAIATGSDNSARYFNYYFSNVPNIIRKNKTGVAIINGTESNKDLELLGYDILCHYGLGCRNISKIFVPKNYDLNNIFGGLYSFSHVMESSKYANNYDYNKAVYLMSEFKFLDNGFFLLKYDSEFKAPLSSAHITEYGSQKELDDILFNNHDQIQCVVSKKNKAGEFNFGNSQKPKLVDYADGINTLSFLSNL